MACADLLGGRLRHFSCRCHGVLAHFPNGPSLLWTRACHCATSGILYSTPSLPNPVLLRIGSVPIPARRFRLRPRGHLPWPLQLYVRLGVTGPSLTAFASTHHPWLHKRCQAEHRHACPYDSFDGRRPSILLVKKSCSISAVRRARVSFKKVLCDTILVPSGSDVAHRLGSNIADRGFMCTRYSTVMGELDDPAQKPRANPCC